KNLISNAIKFTQKGSITIDFKKPTPEMDLSQSDLQPENSIAIVVSDTGIGIPKEKLGAIFEAFQQADGSTSRKFGGTGLGLSISRELTKLLGGELQLISEKDKGSTFTIILPKTKQEVKQEVVKNRRKHNERRQLINISTSSEIKEKKTSPHIEDDRYNIEKNDRKILVIEDDLNFARTLHLFCNNKEFKFIHAGDGESGLELAKKYIPDAIILDIKLPGMNGWEVLEIIKNNPAIRHIPVHMMSAMEEEFDTIQKGAVGYLTKPITNEQLSAAFDRLEEIHNSSIKKLLVVEDNKNMRTAVINLLGDDNVEITAVDTGQKALAEINNKRYDCMILDITLPDISGLEILQKLKHEKKNEIPPVIIYTGKEITKEEELELNQYTGSIIIKGIKSEERLLDETALFLHQVVNEMPKNKQKIISRMHDKFAVFQGKKILVVDDDMRNVFAVSHVLEEKGMIIQSAGDGQKAIEILEKDSDFDLVLMDIMMPVMDGY
ncbi:MAG: response regulator, partial [Candidatus Cloacimonetes bacterium]|nr:response regulator [Candidatus Cloacimonadota bacterium]